MHTWGYSESKQCKEYTQKSVLMGNLKCGKEIKDKELKAKA